MPFKVSDESVNSYGIRVISKGGDFSQFEKNPIMLYDHDDYKRLPIGTWSDLKIHDNGDITAEPEFDNDDEFAASVQKKVDKKIIRMASLGIVPLEWSDDPEMMLPGQVGVTVTKWILREISITPFGSNKNAFKLYDKLGNEINLNENTTFFNLNTKPKMSDSKDNLRVMLAAGLNLSDDISTSEMVRKVLKLHQENEELKTKVQTLENAAKEEKETLELKEKEAYIDKQIEAKKITLKQKPVYMKLEFSDVKEALEGMPAPKDLGKTGDGDGDEAFKEREKWTFKDWTVKDEAGLVEMKEKDPERYKKLFKDEYKVEPNL